MSRLHKISIIVFCFGVLLSGTGAGVAFMEFGGYTYGGKYILGEPDMNLTGSFGDDLCLTADRWLRDGETLGYTAEQKLHITRSEGVNVEGMSLKIGF